MTRTDTTTDQARRRARRQLGVLAVLAVALLMLVAAAAWLAVRRFDDRPPTGSPPSATPTATTDHLVERRRVEWREVAGVRLPFSPVHGPHLTKNGRAAGYSHSRQGAAVAAVQVLARTSPSAGPRVYWPVVGEQVIGTDAGTMAAALDQQYEQLRARATSPVPEGEPLPDNDASVAGFAVTLQWADGDWRAVAPPAGDWGTVSQLLATAPAGLLAYQAA